MNEAALNASWVKDNLGSDKAQIFARDVLNHMRERLIIYQNKYHALYNLEATPAESTAYRLAKHEVEKYPDIITASNDINSPYYTNSSHLPVGYTDDIFEALDIQDELQTLYTSGTVFHAFLGEKLPDYKAAMNLVRKIAENYRLPYYTISPTYSICHTHGYIKGEVYECPKCHEKTEVWSRITGYYRPVQNWNIGKTKEFDDRQEYDMGYHENEVQETSYKTDNHENSVLLFSTRTCPNCKTVKKLLHEHDVEYQDIDCQMNEELVAKYAIMTVPTLIINKEETVVKLDNLSSIIEYYN